MIQMSYLDDIMLFYSRDDNPTTISTEDGPCETGQAVSRSNVVSHPILPSLPTSLRLADPLVSFHEWEL